MTPLTELGGEATTESERGFEHIFPFTEFIWWGGRRKQSVSVSELPAHGQIASGQNPRDRNFCVKESQEFKDPSKKFKKRNKLIIKSLTHQIHSIIVTQISWIIQEKKNNYKS